jgi:hypothetical protein
MYGAEAEGSRVLKQGRKEERKMEERRRRATKTKNNKHETI